MEETSICPRCGAEMPAGTIVCAACALDAALLPEEPIASEPLLYANDAPAIHQSFGSYDLLEVIARGGMGMIYRARQRESKRVVALKMILLNQLDEQIGRERFQAEARAAAALEHPNIVPLYDVGEHDGLPFFTMKFAEGGTLADSAQYRGQFRQIAALMEKVARGLQHAHEHGVLHRDVKPGNILLDASGEPMLSDFGIAKAISEGLDLTRTLAVLGTPAYLSPEQAAGKTKELTAAADIYGLGAVLYELLVGRPPFVAATAMAVLRKVERETPSAPSQNSSGVPRDLEIICLKCLAKEPRDRYASAKLLADDLERWREGRTILARPATGPERVWRWARRNPIVASLLTLVFTLLVAVGLLVFLPKRPPTAATTSTAIPEKSIAVLPFENLSSDKENAYFADGIQDEILTRLSTIADLKVISHTSTQHYKSAPENLPEIAKRLGVAHILEGSVQKSGDAVRVNVQLIKAANDSHLWADTFDRKLADIFSVESEVAKAIADQLRVHLTGREEQVIAAKPTDNVEAYDAYLRGLACSLKLNITANSLGAQKYLREAVRLDPKFALGWALLSYLDARGYITLSLQPTLALREEARQAAETALTLQPNLGEAILAKGYYHYACLRDYDTAVRYYEQARQLLPNSSRIPASLAYVARRRGQWDRSESYFNEAERLDPRNVNLLTMQVVSYIELRRFSEALRKLEQILDIIPDDLDTVAAKAAIAQAEGDLPRASALLAPLHPAADDPGALETQVYQAILERRPAPVIPRLKEILAKPDPAVGFYNGELRFWLGWAQEVAGDQAAAQESWRQARSELESFLKEQPENYLLIGDLALTNMSLGDKAAALALSERAMAAIPIEKDAIMGPLPIDILARVAAQMGEPDRAIGALQKLLSIPYQGPLTSNVVGLPLTPALLRLDPMFDPLRNDPRFQKLVASPAPEAADK